MSSETKRGLENYPEDLMYLPQWRTAFSAEFSRILSQVGTHVESGTYSGLEKLGLKVEKDEESSQLLRILPSTTNYPELRFRIYEGRGIKFMSGNQNREGRNWVRDMRVDLEHSEVVLILGDLEDTPESKTFFKLSRRFDPQVGDGLSVNLSWEKMILLDSAWR